MCKKVRMLRRIILIPLFLLSTNKIYSACCFPGPSSCSSCSINDKTCCIGICDGYPYLLTRPQGRNAARDLVTEQQFVHKYDTQGNYLTASIGVEYQRSFWQDQISRFLFGDDYIDCCNLQIQGSLVENRHPKAWLADYFGLPMDFESEVSFCPKIQSTIFAIRFYAGLDNVTKGLYARLDLPIVWTKWGLHPYEKIKKAGILDFPASYMSPDAIAKDQLSPSFLQYMSSGKTFGDMQEQLRYGRIYTSEKSKVRLSEIRGSLGYDFVVNCDSHFGFFIQLCAPTGNKYCSKYLFEPIVGNGKHWEFGGGISGSWIFWRDCECEDKYIGIWIDATITHLLANKQCRSFDFTCKPNSRYMLLEKMGTNNDTIQGQEDTTLTKAEYQYKSTLVPAINWSTFEVDVRMDIQADIAVKFGFVRDAWSFDIGYNFWAMTGEKFELDSCICEPFYCYAVKGDAFLYGQDLQQTKYPISATQSSADVHEGLNYPAQGNTDFPYENPRIDNPQQAFVNTTALSSIATTTLKTSIQPILLERNNLNLGDSPSATTHKIFFNIAYTPGSNEEYATPFFGFGGQIEFARNRCKTCCDRCKKGCKNKTNEIHCYTCDDCCDLSCDKKAGVSQWGLWVKCGLHFE